MVTYDENKEHPAIARCNMLREKMQEANVDWLIINTADQHLSEYVSDADKARAYFSGFTGSAGTLLISTEEALLWTDSRYYVQAESELSKSNIELMRDGLSGVKSLEEYICENVWNGQRIAIDFKTISFQAYESLKEKLPEDIEIVDGSGIVNSSFIDKPKRVFNPIVSISNIAGCDVKDKLCEVRNLIEKKCFLQEASYTYIVSDLTAIMWLLNLRGEDVSYVQVAYSYLLIDKNVSTLYVNKKAINKDIVDELLENGVNVKEYGTFYRDLDDLATDFVLLDASKTNASISEKASNYCEIKKINDYDFIKKYIKNEKEIAGFKSAHLVDGAIMVSFIRKIKEIVASGERINEYNAGKLLDEMRLNNEYCLDLSFETICAYGKNGAVVHYSAEEESALELCAKGMLLVDSGGHYELGTTDITRTIVLGELTEEEKKCYTLVLKGNLQLMSILFKDGVRGDNLDIIARKPIWENGYSYGHGTGHGIGCRLSVHEGPVNISYKSKTIVDIKPGLVVSDEPGIYIQDAFGVRLENALLAVEKENGLIGFESLTLVPFDRDAIDVSLLSDEEISILNTYHKKVYELISPSLEEADKKWLYDSTRDLVRQ